MEIGEFEYFAGGLVWVNGVAVLAVVHLFILFELKCTQLEFGDEPGHFRFLYLHLNFSNL